MVYELMFQRKTNCCIPLAVNDLCTWMTIEFSLSFFSYNCSTIQYNMLTFPHSALTQEAHKLIRSKQLACNRTTFMSLWQNCIYFKFQTCLKNVIEKLWISFKDLVESFELKVSITVNFQRLFYEHKVKCLHFYNG